MIITVDRLYLKTHILKHPATILSLGIINDTVFRVI